MADTTLRVAIDGSRARTDARALENDLDRLKRSGDGVDSSVRRLNSTLLGFSKINLAGTLTLGAAVTGFVRLADESANLNARLKLATASTAELTRAQTALFAIAQSTSSSFAETSDLYARFANATRVLGISQERLLGITTSVNQAVQLSGASAGAANAALIQLGQGLSSGSLRGEELNSVLEQTPRLAKAIADGFGVTTGQLRALAAENKLTAEAIVAALESQRATLESEFGTLPQTVGRSLTELGNTALQAAGQIDKSAGFTKALSGAITSLSDSLQGGAVRGAIEGLASATGLLTRNLDVLIVFFVGRAALPIVFTAAAAAATTLAGAISLLGPALGIVAAGALGLQAALAPLLGVVGLTTAVISGLAIGFIAIRESESDLDRVIRELTESKKKLTEASGESAEAALKEAFAKRELALAELEQLKNAARQSPFVSSVGQSSDRQRLNAEIDALDVQITELQRRQSSDFLPANLPNIGAPSASSGAAVAIARRDALKDGNEALRLAQAAATADAERANTIYRMIRGTQDQSAELQRQLQTGEELTAAGRELLKLRSGEFDFQFRGREAAKEQLAIDLEGLDTLQKKVEAQDRLNAAARKAAAEIQDGPTAPGGSERRASRRGIRGTFEEIQLNQAGLRGIENGRFEKQERDLRGGTEASLRLEEGQTVDDLVEKARGEHEKRLTEIARQGAMERNQLTQSYFRAGSEIIGNLSDAAESAGLARTKRGFEAAKILSITQATISTAAAVTNALAVPPYPLGVALAASAGIAGLAQIAAIKSQKFGGGRELGGPVDSSRFFEIGEKGRPEIIQDDGKYFLFGANGNVIPASNGSAGGASEARTPIQILINNTVSNLASIQAEESQGLNGETVIRIVAEALTDNASPVSRGVQRRVGRRAEGSIG